MKQKDYTEEELKAFENFPLNQILLEKAIALLQGSEDTGAVVIVALDDFAALQKIVKKMTGVEYG